MPEGRTAGTMSAVGYAVLLSAEIALALTHDATQVADQESFVTALGDGVGRARAAIESGRANALLDRWREATTRKAAAGRR